MISVNNKSGIHPTAIIEKAALVDKTAFVGAYAIVHDNVQIGKHCYVDAHAVIGAVPFDDYDEKVLNPVILEEGAWIGAHVIIQCGVDRHTIIGAGAMVNHGCSIGHDVQIGQGCEIGLATTISGHSNLEEGVRVGPGCTINNRSELGSFSRVGIGSLVLHPVAEGDVVVGRPAMVLSDYKKQSLVLRQLSGDDRASRPVTSFVSEHFRYLQVFRPMAKFIPRGLKVVLKNWLTK